MTYSKHLKNNLELTSQYIGDFDVISYKLAEKQHPKELFEEGVSDNIDFEEPDETVKSEDFINQSLEEITRTNQ